MIKIRRRCWVLLVYRCIGFVYRLNGSPYCIGHAFGTLFVYQPGAIIERNIAKHGFVEYYVEALRPAIFMLFIGWRCPAGIVHTVKVEGDIDGLTHVA